MPSLLNLNTEQCLRVLSQHTNTIFIFNALNQLPWEITRRNVVNHVIKVRYRRWKMGSTAELLDKQIVCTLTFRPLVEVL